jgi:hypothetical protein
MLMEEEKKYIEEAERIRFKTEQGEKAKQSCLGCLGVIIFIIVFSVICTFSYGR